MNSESSEKEGICVGRMTSKPKHSNYARQREKERASAWKKGHQTHAQYRKQVCPECVIHHESQEWG